VIETDHDFWRSSSAGGSTSPMPQSESTISEAVFASDDLLVVEDVQKNERYSENPLLLKRGVRAFASTPLRSRSGHLVGNLCILDTQPREFTPAERELLESLATQLMDTVEPEGQTTEPSPALT
jgi:GAF domain-containing protein